MIGKQKFESGFESESESTNFFLNPNPDSAFQGLNPNPNPNPAKNALNPGSNPNPDSDSHITDSRELIHDKSREVSIECSFSIYLFGNGTPLTCTIQKYTLLQKKRNFSEPIFPRDPGSLIMTLGHVHFVKWF